MERLPYPTDLTDAQWQKIQEALPEARGGRTGAYAALAQSLHEPIHSKGHFLHGLIVRQHRDDDAARLRRPGGRVCLTRH